MIRILADSNENVSIPTHHDIITNQTRPAPSTSEITKAITDFPNKKTKIKK